MEAYGFDWKEILRLMDVMVRVEADSLILFLQ